MPVYDLFIDVNLA